MSEPDEYQWLFRRAPAMAASIAEGGVFLDVNDALIERLGYAREEMIGRRPEEFATEESARRITDEFRPALRRAGKLENKPVSFVTRSGDVVDCMTNAIFAQAPNRSFMRTIAMFSDISDEARANFKYRTLYRSTPAMLHTVDGNGLIITVTDHWLQKLGYTRKQVIGRRISDFFNAADRKRFAGERIRDLISTGDFTNLERQMVTRKGEILELLTSSLSHRDAGGKIVQMLVASKDVTQRNRAERQLRRTLAENARLREELEIERDYLREEVSVAYKFGSIVGTSAALKQMLLRVEAVANTTASVLILGESGVGKELVAREIHNRSPRSDRPLVRVNCASISKDLFESEFFGHVKGSFTGAHKDRIGRFQLADGGTIFLDEVGEIPLESQGKLLRVLQESEFERVGDDETRSVDVRVIAATNSNLEERIAAGQFREDLYYRLSVFPVEVPALRDRGEDLVQLAQHFLEQACRDFGREPMTLTQVQVRNLRGYDWPGNVRELKNVIERAVILSPGNVLRLDKSMLERRNGENAVPAPASVDGKVLTEEEMRELQRNNIIAALEQSDWRVSGRGGAAELLELRPTTLADRIRAHGIRKPAKG